MDNFDLTKFLTENKLTALGKLSKNNLNEGMYGEDETISPHVNPRSTIGSDNPRAIGLAEEEIEEAQEDYSKYNSVEELMKEIENSTNEAAHKHKMERVKKAYESLESTATSLEEGEHASYISPSKIKEMKASAKKLRKMHETLSKVYEKKYSKKKEM